MIVLSKFIYFIFLFFSISSFSQEIILTPRDDIFYAIEHGQIGDRFLLKKGVYAVSRPISVPSGVIITGELGVVLSSNTYLIGLAFFDISGVNDVEISHLSFQASSQNVVVLANKNLLTQNIKINNLVFEKKSIGAEFDQSQDIFSLVNIDHGKNIEISNNTITGTVGGIYVTGDNINIHDNKLTSVNFGNIVVSGNDIDIFDNIIFNSGHGTLARPSAGDGITVGDFSSNITIRNNVIQTCYCYCVWVHSNGRDIRILNNNINSSVTHGIFVDDGAENLIVRHNEFSGNFGAGLAISKVFGKALISENKFILNSIYIDPRNQSIEVKNNIFLNMLFSEPVVNEDYSALFSESNSVVDFSDSAEPPSLLVVKSDGGIIHNHDVLYFDKDTFFGEFFYIKNEGQLPIKLTGFPPVSLSLEISNHDTDFRVTPALGGSYLGKLAIFSSDEPAHFDLFAEDAVTFSIKNMYSIGLSQPNADPLQEEYIVNIPTDCKLYQPFWFKIVLR